MSESPTLQIDLVWFALAMIMLLGAATAGVLLVRRVGRASDQLAPTLELVLVVLAALIGVGFLFRALAG
jgi:hypothetical protein